MKILKKILLIFFFAFLLIQFIRPEKNSDPDAAIQIKQSLNLPGEVEIILKKACYDCHSNNTRYPWYANIQPAAGFLSGHVKNGKSELNFNTLASLDKRRKRSRFRSIEEVVEKATMPLSSYTILHNDAKLTKNEKEILINWAETSEDLTD